MLPHFDYANALLAGIPKKDINKLQSLQNHAAKVVLNRKKFDSSKQALFDLKWLPIEERILFKVLCYVYKGLNGLAPKYISELLKLRSTPYDLRGDEEIMLEVPATKYVGFGDRAFSVFGPRNWNKLPKEIKMSPNFDTFKSNLKRHLLETAFEDITSN